MLGISNLCNVPSDSPHVWFWVGFSGSPDRTALCPVESNLRWRPAITVVSFCCKMVIVLTVYCNRPTVKSMLNLLIIRHNRKNIQHQAELPESCSRLGNCDSAVDNVRKRQIIWCPIIRDDDVVSPQLLGERSHEDGIRIEVYATVLEQNIRSPYVTNMRQHLHPLSEYLYHRNGRTNKAQCYKKA